MLPNLVWSFHLKTTNHVRLAKVPANVQQENYYLTHREQHLTKLEMGLLWLRYRILVSAFVEQIKSKPAILSVFCFKPPRV
jgi:hypothetical protein